MDVFMVYAVVIGAAVVAAFMGYGFGVLPRGLAELLTGWVLIGLMGLLVWMTLSTALDPYIMTASKHRWVVTPVRALPLPLGMAVAVYLLVVWAVACAVSWRRSSGD